MAGKLVVILLIKFVTSSIYESFLYVNFFILPSFCRLLCPFNEITELSALVVQGMQSFGVNF